MNTQKLYYEDMLKKECTATIIAIEKIKLFVIKLSLFPKEVDKLAIVVI